MNKLQIIEWWDEYEVYKHCDFELQIIIRYFQERGLKTINFIDIGANVGKFYEVLSKKINIQSCYMVEPDTDLFNYLTSKYKEDEKTTLYNFALSDYSGLGFLSELDYIQENINLGLAMIKPEGQGYEIQVKDACSFIKKVYDKTPSIDLIKIDTENQDYIILDRIREVIVKLENKPLIVFEHNCWDDKKKAEEIYNKFLKIGYKGEPFSVLQGDCVIYPNN
jgi:FkbM family methyltransferase